MSWLIHFYFYAALLGLALVIIAIRAPDLSDWASPVAVAGVLLLTIFGGAALGSYLVTTL